MSAAKSASSKRPSECRHARRRTVWQNGTLRDTKERTDSYEAAWCPDCGSFRPASSTVDAEPWVHPGMNEIASNSA